MNTQSGIYCNEIEVISHMKIGKNKLSNIIIKIV